MADDDIFTIKLVGEPVRGKFGTTFNGTVVNGSGGDIKVNGVVIKAGESHKFKPPVTAPHKSSRPRPPI